METPLHPQNCVVWFAPSKSGNVGTISLEGAVTADRCLHVAVLDVLNADLADRVFSRCFSESFGLGQSWSSYYLVLNPCDYFL